MVSPNRMEIIINTGLLKAKYTEQWSICSTVPFKQIILIPMVYSNIILQTNIKHADESKQEATISVLKMVYLLSNVYF